MKELELMQQEKQRIQQSIIKITNLAQITGTYNWVRVFEERFGATGVANNLRTMLTNVIL